MKPTLNEQDVVIVKGCKNDELKIGDIITFNRQEEIISHRIINIFKEENKLKIKTKGDNNEIEDNFILEEEDIIGKVCFKLKGIGKLVTFIQNGKGFFSSIAIITIIFIMISMNDNRKNNRKVKRKKYEIKRLRDNYSL